MFLSFNNFDILLFLMIVFNPPTFKTEYLILNPSLLIEAANISVLSQGTLAKVDLFIIRICTPQQNRFWELLSAHITINNDQEVLVWEDFNEVNNFMCARSHLTRIKEFSSKCWNLLLEYYLIGLEIF